MLVCQVSGLSSSWSPFNKTFHDKERLIDLLKGSLFFANTGSNIVYTYRTAVEFVNNGREDFVINLIQTITVYIESLKGNMCDFKIYAAIAFDLCIVMILIPSGVPPGMVLAHSSSSHASRNASVVAIWSWLNCATMSAK